MKRLTKNPNQGQGSHGPLSTLVSRRIPGTLFVSLLAVVLIFSACGTSPSKLSENSGPLSGNWQFQITTDNSFISVNQNCAPATTPPTPSLCVEGFLLQKGGSVSGQLAYSITLPSQPGTFCNSGSASVTGTVNGQNVTLTALAAKETFTLTGTLSPDGSTMTGTYTSDGQGCGNPQSGTTATWTAILVPSLSGAVQGRFHSSQNSSVQSLINQDYPVTGFLTQGANIGASSATVTGTLNFQNYPCLSNASVSGEISGNVVLLNIIALNGLKIGSITSTVQSSAGGHVLLGSNGYSIATKQCSSGDVGNVCLGQGGAKACLQPITLSPAFLDFPIQGLGAPSSSQTITLTNTDPSGVTLNGLQLVFTSNPASQNFPNSDFDELPNFTEQDNCASTPGGTFSLAPQQSCNITVIFSPQQSCPWIPTGSPCPPFLPASIPSPPALTAALTVNGVSSATQVDPNTTFSVPVTGLALSAIQPSTPELDFGAEAIGEASLPQTVSLINRSAAPVQILPSSACISGPLPRPPTPGSVAGLQTLIASQISPFNSTINYVCDADLTTGLPNFQVSNDNCSGVLLMPQQSCSLSVTYAPQSPNAVSFGLTDLLELNTNWCGDGTGNGSPNCEIDSGRFPVELTANLPSPLRMKPAAGLDFTVPANGDPIPPQAITLFNDPNDPSSQVIHFTGNVVRGDFAETDNCGLSLSPGNSCTMEVTFAPTTTAFEQGNITVTYNGGQTQIIHLRGFGQ